MVEVSANIVVSDNNDPNPKVKLVSIVCNDCDDPAADIRSADTGTDDRAFLLKADRLGKRKDGRVYTVTYSATDAAGNVATSQATVTVPQAPQQKMRRGLPGRAVAEPRLALVAGALTTWPRGRRYAGGGRFLWRLRCSAWGRARLRAS